MVSCRYAQRMLQVAVQVAVQVVVQVAVQVCACHSHLRGYFRLLCICRYMYCVTDSWRVYKYLFICIVVLGGFLLDPYYVYECLYIRMLIFYAYMCTHLHVLVYVFVLFRNTEVSCIYTCIQIHMNQTKNTLTFVCMNVNEHIYI